MTEDWEKYTTPDSTKSPPAQGEDWEKYAEHPLAPVTQASPSAPSTGWSYLPGYGLTPVNVPKMISNIPSSAYHVGRGLLDAITSGPTATSSPLRAIPQAIAGGLEKLAPGTFGTNTPAQKTADVVGGMLKERYGNFGNTIETDPVGAAMDVAGLASGAGAGLKAAGTISKVPWLLRAGEVASTAGEALDPITQLSRIGTKMLGGPAKLGASLLTGKTPEEIGQIVKSGISDSPDFKNFMRGDQTGGNLVDAARDGLAKMKTDRGAAYKSTMADIEQKYPAGSTTINRAPVDAQINNLAKDFRITKNPNGSWNLDQSLVSRAARKDVSELLDDVQNWNDWSPQGADALKKYIDDFYPSATTKNSAAITTGLRNAVKGEIVKQVPEYTDLVAPYEAQTEKINRIQQVLALKPGSNPQSALTKLSTVMKENKDIAGDVLDVLQTEGGQNLKDMVAGMGARQKLPTGLVARSVDAGAIFALGNMNPWLLPLMVGSSPRVIGEFSVALGKAMKVWGKVPQEVKTVGRAAAIHPVPPFVNQQPGQ